MNRFVRVVAVLSVVALVAAGCAFDPAEMQVPGTTVSGDTYPIDIQFGNVLNLPPGAKVLADGVEVGNLTGLEVHDPAGAGRPDRDGGDHGREGHASGSGPAADQAGLPALRPRPPLQGLPDHRAALRRLRTRLHLRRPGGRPGAGTGGHTAPAGWRYPPGTSSVITSNCASQAVPKEVEIATSVASLPRAIRMRPMRGLLWRASKVCQRPLR